MKNVSRFRFAFVSSALLLLGSCSKSQYTFAPNTGGYHGTEKKAVAVAEPETIAEKQTENQTAEASITPEKPAEISSAQVEASQKIAQAFSGNTTVVEQKTAVSTTDKVGFKLLKKDLKQLLKKKNSSESKGGLGLSSNVKLLFVLGIAFVLLGIVLKSGLIYAIGGIFLIIALVLFLMEIL